MPRAKKNTASVYVATRSVTVYTPDRHGFYTQSVKLAKGDTITIETPCQRDEKLIAKGILTLAQ